MNQYTKKVFNSFQPAVSREALKSMGKQIKYEWKLHTCSGSNLRELAKKYNPVIRGWMQYYGKFYITELNGLANCLNLRLVK